MLGAILIVLSACDDGLLDVNPSTSITIDQAFTDAKVFESYIIGMYDELTDNNYTNRLIPYVDIKGGDVLIIPAGNFGRYDTDYIFVESPNSAYASDNVWFQAYDVIGLANPAILAIPDAPLTDEQKPIFEAELRAFRAKALHDLIRVFAQPYNQGRDNLGVVLNTEVTLPTDPGLPRSSVGEIYDQILDDLIQAEQLMPESRTDTYKWTKKSIQGMLARVYLDMEMWDEASKWANTAYQDVTLMTGTEWQEGFYSATSEWMFWAGVTEDDMHGFLSPHSFWASNFEGYSSFRLDMAFIDDKFSDTDVRGRSLLLMDENNGSPIISTGYVSNKLIFADGFLTDVVYMRASEMYLIYAEAEANLGSAENIANAQDALYTIQLRADDQAVKSNNTGNALLEEIYLERRKELYAEGFAYFDLQRLNRDVVRSEEGGHYGELFIPFNDYRRLSPIPQFELDANEVIRSQQNPGYGN